uniref:Pacifastin domain-containing protein n=1 Tax=Globodera pallida TaxID=36090 RepID=A0A183BYB9_GLOPA
MQHFAKLPLVLLLLLLVSFAASVQRVKRQKDCGVCAAGQKCRLILGTMQCANVATHDVNNEVINNGK